MEWKSFQLSPNTLTDPATNIDIYLAKHKGISLEEAKEMNNRVTELAKHVGLDYHFDKAVVANTFNAHQFLHFTKKSKRQNEAKERLMHAYFTEGKNIDDLSTLIELGKEVGLDSEDLKVKLENNAYSGEVIEDINEAQKLGIRGVPFFVFDRKFGISGAQDVAVFLQTLEKAFSEWKNTNPESFEVIDGNSCEIDNECK